jgi:predicted dehydrogenase
MKIGLIGFGSIGQRHYSNLQKYSSQVVVFSKRKDLNAPQVATSWADFVKNGPYYIIFITNETFKHVPTLKGCLPLKPQAIFVEKPLSHDLNALLTVARLVKQRQISLWVGYNFHFFKPFIRIKKIIQSGKLGRLYYLRAFIGQDLRTWRERDYRQNYAISRRQGGGVILDLVHDINYPAWLLDDILVPKTALVGKLSDLNIDTEDFAETILIGKRSGVVVTVHQDYFRVPRKQSLEIGGAKGAIEWDSIENTVTLQTSDKTTRQIIVSERNEMFVDELEFFMSQVKKKRFFTNIDEAKRDMEVISFVKKYAKKSKYYAGRQI